MATFRINYITETGNNQFYDGVVLDISINGGAFGDIITAGGSFITGGYDGAISSNYGNPLSGRMAWSGNSLGYITSAVVLPAAANGQSVQLRWRMGTDHGNAAPGMKIDSPCLSASVTGTVTYGNAASPPKYISNVTVTSSGSTDFSTKTFLPGANAGQYILTGFTEGSYTVSLSKTAGQNGINSFDAARITQHVVGISLLTTNNQKVSADVTGNNAVSSQDAAKIAQYAAGLPFSPPNLTGQWKFFLPPGPTFPVGSSSTSRTYPSPTGNITGEDYIGLLLGDVTGNWTPSAARPVGSRRLAAGNGPQRVIAVELLSSFAAVDKEIIIPVNAQAIAEKDVISYEFTLRYDPSVIQPIGNGVDLENTTSRGLSVVTNTTKPGLLRVVVYGPSPIAEDGVLLNLRFMAMGASDSVSPLMFERISFNEGEPGVATTDGQVELSAAEGRKL